MNPNWTDAETWIDILDHIWIGLVVIFAAGVPSWLAARNHVSIKKVQDQVVNGHTTPMRQDVDEIRDTLNDIRSDLHMVKSDISDIRSELRQERKDRIDLDDRFERFKRNR